MPVKHPPLRLTLIGAPADIALTVDTVRLFGVITYISPAIPTGPAALAGTVRHDVLVDVVGPTAPLQPHLAAVERYHTDPDTFLHDDVGNPPW